MRARYRTNLTANLNLASNDLPYRVENGSFFVHVTHKETGIKTAHQVNIDGDAMSLNDVVTAINTTVNVPNVTASVSVGTFQTFASAVASATTATPWGRSRSTATK